MKDVLDELERTAVSRIAAAESAEELEKLRLEFLGKKARLSLVLRSLGGVPPEERSGLGQRANLLRRSLEERLKEQSGKLSKVLKPRAFLDLTLPGTRPERGAVHPITRIIAQITDIFEKLNFEWVEGREVETAFYNFTALNIPEDHPSRDSFDTFFTKEGHLLRSQTSTVQIRVMEKRKPPLRIIAPGRVYRPDTVDASHSFMFHQIEGLMVDEKTTFSDLKGMIHVFLRALFGKKTKVRFRPHFFPFTEPSVEVDMSCFICDAKGCSVCGQKGWLEVMGAGSVDPNVFKAVGYDAKAVQGFAFGLGVERIAMLKYGITDIRLFYENDIRFLKQFQ
ncbi:MAG TPA: phenylalanine--tRNA ligase subunit alpha [Candidatus Omnitrophota bacterium]|nr:phenylalanine--tRNA ligase subunit alpha [Candidatus Omnitrophota bacterium]